MAVAQDAQSTERFCETPQFEITFLLSQKAEKGSKESAAIFSHEYFIF